MPSKPAVDPSRPLSHAALTASAVCLLPLAPMVAHVAWRPAAVAFGGVAPGAALRVSIGAVVVVGVGALIGRASLGSPATRRAAAGVGLAVVAAALGLGLAGAAGAVSLLLVALVTAAALPKMQRALAPVLAADPMPVTTTSKVAWGMLMLACTVHAASLATYFGDPAAPGVGIDRGGFLGGHLCLTAYLHAAELARAGVANIYDLSLVPAMASDGLPATAAHMAPFTLDRFGYPPQFVLAPLALIELLDDFAAQRAVWNCVNALFLAYAMWRVALMVGPQSGRVARWASPALWMLGGATLQAGNVQLTVVGMGVLAMLAVHQGRDRAGGAMLATITLAKISPGLLGVVLLAQRRWRAVGWTVAVAVLISALSLWVLGPGPFEAFLSYHLPKVASGEAFDFLDDNFERVFENLSPFGLPFKLEALGIGDDPWTWAPRVATAYTVLAFGLAAVVGRRKDPDRRTQAATALLVLTMAGLRSPMAPGYLLAGVFWAMLLVAPEVRSWRGWALGFGLVGAMMLATPFAPVHHLAGAFLGQLALHGTLLWLLLRRWPVLDPERTAASPPRPQTSLPQPALG